MGFDYPPHMNCPFVAEICFFKYSQSHYSIILSLFQNRVLDCIHDFRIHIIKDLINTIKFVIINQYLVILIETEFKVYKRYFELFHEFHM